MGKYLEIANDFEVSRPRTDPTAHVLPKESGRERPKASVLAHGFSRESVERSGRFKLITDRSGPIPISPIMLNSCTEVVNVEKFIDAALADLAAYVACRNGGKKHWAEDLLDEKLQALRAYGIEAKIVQVQ